jgi:hypothetical protein
VLLEEIGKADVEEALALERRSMQSPDRDLRLVAASALARQGDRATADLLAMLHDPSREVRGVGARALLDGRFVPEIPEAQLEAHFLLGQTPLEWEPVIRLGPAVRPVIEVALRGDDPAVRREAATLLRFYDYRRQAKPGLLSRLRRRS